MTRHLLLLDELGLVPFFAGRHVKAGTFASAARVFGGRDVLHLDPQRVADAPFLAGLRVVDRLFFGPRDQVMPSWVLYDCALAPGVVFGLATPASRLPPAFSSEFGTAPESLVPVSMMSVLPRPDRRSSLIHTLAWLSDATLGEMTLALGLDVLDLGEAIVTATWGSPELQLFANLHPLKLRTAWTTAHDVRATATFEFRTQPLALSEPLETLATTPTDDRLQALETRIEAGERLWIEPIPGGFSLHREA
jgi:hypothetical protein